MPKNFHTKTEYEKRAFDACGVNESEYERVHPWVLAKYMFFGMIFGIVLVKGEVVSWFRIQEMFRLESFHMYGIIGTAVVVGMISVFLIKKTGLKSYHGEDIKFDDKRFLKGQIFGGLIFGFGWAMTGACPGPMFAQLGTGAIAVGATILSAIAGTWVYGYFRERLPH